MLTPGERVLTVSQNNAFESLLRSLAIPVQSNSNIVNTTNSEEVVINNEFNNNFGSNAVDDMMALSQNTDTKLLRR